MPSSEFFLIPALVLSFIAIFAASMAARAWRLRADELADALSQERHLRMAVENNLAVLRRQIRAERRQAMLGVIASEQG